MSDYQYAITRDIEEPSGGWTYKVPHTGVTITAHSAYTMRMRVRAHLRANDIPIQDDFDEWLDDDYCRQSGVGSPFCGRPVPKPPAGKVVPSLAMLNRFVETMIRVIKARRFVPREEAERRAAICVNCPANTKLGWCRKCQNLLGWAMRVMKGFQTEAKPDVCARCGCLLRVKVWIPNALLDKAEKAKVEYEPGCWRNSSST